jgi:hypothetical protein
MIKMLNIPEINWNDDTISQENNSEYFDTIQWSKKNNKQKNFNDCPILLSCSNKYFNKKKGKNMYSYRFVGYHNWNDALKFVNTKRYIYEDFLIGKPYIDHEQSIPIEEYADKKDIYDKNAKKQLKTMIQYIKQAMNILLSDDRIENKDYEILVAKSHGLSKDGTTYKFSFHFVVNGSFRFKNTNDARQLANLIKSISRGDSVISKDQPSEEDAKNPEDGVTNYIDMSVYKKSLDGKQKFRCIYSPKTVDDNRILIPIDHKGNVIQKVNILDYMVGYHEGIIQYFGSIPIPEKINNSKNRKRSARSSKKNELLPKEKQTDKKKSKEPSDDDVRDDSDDDADGDNQNEMIEPDKNDKIVHDKKRNESIKRHRLVNSILRNTIKSARIDGTHESDDGTLFYSFNYNHDKHRCVYGDDSHDHIGGYAYIKDGCSVYAGCYSEKCKHLKAINIGNILDKSYWLTHDDFIEINSEHIGENNIVKKEIKNFINSSVKSVLSTASCIGSGKSTMMRDISDMLFNLKKDARVLVLSTRRSYADDVENNIFKNMDFVNYKEVDGCLSQYNRLIVSLESIGRLYEKRITHSGEKIESMYAYDLIFIDEVDSICQQLFSDTIEHKIETFNSLQTLLHTAKKIVALDADLDNRGFCLIDSIKGNHIKMHNIYKKAPRKYTMVNNYEKYLDSIIKDIESGSNVCVVSLSQKIGLDIRDRLQEKFKNIKDSIVCIHSGADKELLDSLKDVKNAWSQFRVLIFTSCVGVGINYDIINYYERVYGYCVGNVESARVFLQMIGRIRHPKNTDVVIMVSPRMSKNKNAQIYSFDYSYSYYNSNIEFDKSYYATTQYIDNNGKIEFIKTYGKSTWNILRAYFIQEKRLNNTNSNFYTMLKILIEGLGDVFEEDFTEKTNEKFNIKKNIDRIIDAPLVNDDDGRALMKKEKYTEDDRLKLAKYKMRRSLGIKEDADNDKLNECLKLYEMHCDTVDNICEYYKKEAKLNKKIVKKTNKQTTNNKQKKSIDNKKQNKEVLNNHEYQQNHMHSIYSKIINELKFNIDFSNHDVNKIIYYDKNTFDNALEKINISREEIGALKTRGKANDKYNVLKIALSRFGIKLSKKHKNVRINGTKANDIVGYDLQYTKDVFVILRCKMHFEKKKFDKKFALFVDNFKTYDDCLDKQSENYILSLPKLFK